MDDYQVRKTKYIADVLEYEEKYELWSAQENLIWKGVTDPSYDPLLFVPDRPTQPDLPTPYIGYVFDKAGAVNGVADLKSKIAADSATWSKTAIIKNTHTL